MVVAKKQGRSEDQSEDFRKNKQHSWLSPICTGQARGEAKRIKGGGKACALLLSCVRARSLSPPSHALLHSLPFKSWGWHALTL